MVGCEEKSNWRASKDDRDALQTIKVIGAGSSEAPTLKHQHRQK